MIASRNYAPLVANFFNYQTPPQHQTLIWQENTQESGDLNQFLALARRRGWLLIGTSLVVSSGVAVKSLDTLDKNEIYTGKFRLLVEPANLDSTSNFLKKNSGQSISSLDDPNQIQVLWSNQVISPIAESIQVKYPEINSDILARKLKINRLDHTKIWEISYQDAHPEKIKFVLEQVAQGYIKYSLNQQQVNLQQGLEFAEIKLSNLQTEIEQIETELEQFRQENNLLEPSIQVQTLSRALSNVRIARETTQRELAERESLAKNLQAQLELDLEAAIKVVALSAAPRYQELLSQLQEIEQQIAFESARFTENNPVIQKLQAQKQNLLSLLEKEAKAVLGGIDFNGEVPVLVTNSNSRQLQVTQDLVEINNQILLLQSRERNLAIAE
ncbi:MAG: protein tyrosine kinase, partial [Oscillatoria sp. PMC 1076.18]|nr:protein tyrosine kinase [Oscillatoria sp. PMC 1076.18]